MNKLWRQFRQCDLVDSLSEECQKLRLEIQDLNRRLESARKETESTKGHLNFAVQFIAARHRVAIPAEPGTIRAALKQAEK